MVQFCVVNCCSCDTYQGRQVIKGKTWICKICGEKQSFKKIFAQGTGRECRQMVQRLNMVNGSFKHQMLKKSYAQETQTIDHANEKSCGPIQTRESKWNKFLSIDSSDATETIDSSENSIKGSFTTERETFNKAQKRKKPMEDMTSDNALEYQQGNLSNRNRKHPNSKSILTSQSPLSNFNRSQNGCTPSGSSSLPQGFAKVNDVQPETPSENCLATKMSKWSKYM